MASDLTHAGQAQNLMKGLRVQGFSEQQCRDIGYDNVIGLLKRVLKQE